MLKHGKDLSPLRKGCAEVKYIGDGLVEEGWNYNYDLPEGWMFKKYSHKIEGIDTDVLYHLAPNGVIYRLQVKKAF